jgi:hypothetical protein
LECLQGRLDDILVGVVDNVLAAIVECGGDELVRVRRLVRLDEDREIGTSGGRVNDGLSLERGGVEPRGREILGG